MLLLYYCNIMFTYRINKVVRNIRNISINILDYKGEKL